MENLFRPLPSELPEELTTVLLEGRSARIERIVSMGHASATDFWYDQIEHEWVVLLSGEASLMFEDKSEPVLMQPGDHISIPPHCRHRIEWTAPDEPTIWLAVFCSAESI